MTPELFVSFLGVAITALLCWGVRTLPHERWQFIASIPVAKQADGTWRGSNITYYGFFVATAYLFGVLIFFTLLGSVAVSLVAVLALVFVLTALCVPAASIIARIVEKKAHTFTVGGAAFAGIILAPWVTWLLNRTIGSWAGYHAPIVTVCAALALGYAFGEGIGRLACISFGCCYGRPLAHSNFFLRHIFHNRCCVFSGKTKKLAYADNLDGVKVIPIQAVTAVINCAAGLGGTYLFLTGRQNGALLTAVLTTQLWRVASEFLRADFRGNRRFTAYQAMAVIAALYVPCMLFIFSPPISPPADIVAGLAGLWNPLIIIGLQCLWTGILLFTGRSTVTASTVSFHVVEENI